MARCPLQHFPVLVLCASAAGCSSVVGLTAGESAPPLRAVLIPAREFLASFDDVEQRPSLREASFNAVVFAVEENLRADEFSRLRRFAQAEKLPLYLWIEVGRNTRLADRHPEWIAGIGAHEDWRERFPAAPRPGPGERIGVYPWTPIRYRAVMEDRRRAIAELLRGRTGQVAGVFLDAIQGAPAACGCPNDQCRWTADYRMPGGPEKVEGEPAALLAAALERDLPDARWIPVWVTECERHDQGEGDAGYCHTVSCFSGLCWKESSRELDALARQVPGPIALLAAARRFGRELLVYEPAGGWLAESLDNLETIPPRYGHPPLPRRRVIAVVEGGGDLRGDAAAADRALRAGAAGAVVARMPLDGGWEPRLIPSISASNPKETQGEHRK